MVFPDGFLWGAATAAHQVEGGNTSSDFWVLEHSPGSRFAEPSGEACDHYRLYREDIALLAELGLTTYRFSIEWARVEPEEGHFSSAAKVADERWGEEFDDFLPAMRGDDFLGVQNYSRVRVGPDGTLPHPEDAELTQMGYRVSCESAPAV